MFYHIHQTIYFDSTLTLQDVWGDAIRVLPLFLSFLFYKPKSTYLWAKVGTFGRKSSNALPELMMK